MDISDPRNDVSRAYCAGWFDARGYVRIGCQKYRKPRLTLYIRMPKLIVEQMINLYPGARLEELRGTAVSITNGRGSMRKSPGGYHFAATGAVAYRFLEDIQPFVQFRKEFLELSMSFLDLTTNHGVRVKKDEGQELLNLVATIREAGLLNT